MGSKYVRASSMQIKGIYLSEACEQNMGSFFSLACRSTNDMAVSLMGQEQDIRVVRVYASAVPTHVQQTVNEWRARILDADSMSFSTIPDWWEWDVRDVGGVARGGQGSNATEHVPSS